MIKNAKNDNLTAMCQISKTRQVKTRLIKLTTPKQQRGFYVSKEYYNTLASKNLDEKTINDLLTMVAIYNATLTLAQGEQVKTIASKDLQARVEQAKRNKKAFLPYGKEKSTQGIYSLTFAFDLQGLQVLLQLPKHYGANALSKLQNLINTNKTLATSQLNYLLTIHLPKGKQEQLILAKSQNVAYHTQALAIKHNYDTYHTEPQAKQHI